MKSALYICKPDRESMNIAFGYEKVLRHIGWKVIIHDPKIKTQTIEIIDEHNIDMIFTSCKYGMSQLPIEYINEKRIKVVVEALPCNGSGLYVDDMYHVADSFDIDTVNSLNHKLVHTTVEKNLWDKYFSEWIDVGVKLCHVRYAGDIFCSIPNDLNRRYAFSFVGSLAHKEDRIESFILPVLKRLSFRCFKYNMVGDYNFGKFGIKSNGSFVDDKDLCDIYASSTICPNFHRTTQIETQGYLNERSFALQLCGGLQITDMKLANEVFSGNVLVAETASGFVGYMEDFLDERVNKFDKLMESITDAAENHTYFNRLRQIFGELLMDEDVESCIREGSRISNLHIWDLEPKVQAAKKGERYVSCIKRIL